MKYLNMTFFTRLTIISFCISSCMSLFPPNEKPVIYLYPTEKTEVTVELDYQGTLDFVYPDFDPNLDAWHVEAYPDGKLINIADEKNYPYLFWEGRPAEFPDYDLTTGFVVEGEKRLSF